MKDITIDVILTNTHNFTNANASQYNSIEVGWRTFEMWRYISAMRDLELALSNYPSVNFRYIVQPSKSLTDQWVPISFKETQKYID